MSHPTWNEMYAAGGPLPWDTGAPDPQLVEMVTSGALRHGRALEVGCGTGTNALYLAEHGFDVIAVDLAPAAIEKARRHSSSRTRFETCDFLTTPPTGGPFDLVFDRGCFHVFDTAEERLRFATNVAAQLVEGGVWLSLIGSTEGPARESGPPRRSARDIMDAIEPALEIVLLRSADFGVYDERLKAWTCLARKRSIPAAASSRH